MLNVFECCYKYLKNLLFDPFWLSVRQGNMFVKPYWIVLNGMKSEFCCIVQFGQMHQNQQVNDSRPTVATRDHGATTRDRNGCDSRPGPSNFKTDFRDSRPSRSRLETTSWQLETGLEISGVASHACTTRDQPLQAETSWLRLETACSRVETTLSRLGCSL